MAQRLEDAQNGVLAAIWVLDGTGKFTKILDDLRASVLPKYLDLWWPFAEVEGDALTPPTEKASSSYAAHSRDRVRRLKAFEDALGNWARKFRLTSDLSATGEPLAWILEFGRALCSGRSYRVSPARTHSAARKETMPPPGRPLVPEPNPKTENRSAYVRRVKDHLYAHYRAVYKKQRSNPLPAKRKPSHYEWFVLYYCDRQNPARIANMLNALVQADAVRKGVGTVRTELGLGRK